MEPKYIISVLFLMILGHVGNAQTKDASVHVSKKCPLLKKMEVLPGRGWDNLRSMEMGQVFVYDYSECRTTEDNEYLLPNNVFAVPIKESNLDITSEIIDHWFNYTSINSQSFKAHAGGTFGAFSVEGSFGTDYQQAKQHQVDEKSMTTRIQLRNTMFSIGLEPSAVIDPSLRVELMNIAVELKAKNMDKVECLMEFVVREYGTHYVTFAKAGAVLYQEDQVKSKFMQDNWADKSQVAAAASVSFLEKFDFGVSYRQSVNTEVQSGYKSNQTSSKVRALGGARLQPNLSVHNWSLAIPNNLVAVDRGGDPLHFIFTPTHFPDLSLEMLGRMRGELESAITRYYTANTHVGCVDVNSENFDYTANVNNGACKNPMNNYTFGGIYQQCQVMAVDSDELCLGLNQPNPLTGSHSCMPGYRAIPLVSGTKTFNKTIPKCQDHCHQWYVFFRKCEHKCEDIIHQIDCNYQSFWCEAPRHVSNNTGLMFAGLYTPRTNNPVTSTMSCPPTFWALRAGEDLLICTGSDYELGYKYAVPFGGFFSCSQGNPLMADKTKANSTVPMPLTDDPYPHGCPDGYSQHVATINDGCSINYCVKADVFSGHGQMPIVLPPFRDPSVLFFTTTPYVLMNHSNVASPATLAPGAVAGVVISCLMVLATVVLIGVCKYKRRQRSNGQEYEPLPNEGENRPLETDNDMYGSLRENETNPNTTVTIATVN